MSPSSTIAQQPIPVTLLSGFLGSGKTTLLRHILTSPDTNLRIAVIVNDMAALNIDAALVKKHIVSQANDEDKLIQLQNGCICCTLRGDLLEALVDLAQNGQADYIVIESTGISEPMQVAETFTEDFTSVMTAAVEDEQAMDIEGPRIEGAEVLKKIQDLGGLHNIVKLDTLITMVDAYNFFDNFTTTEFITNRWGKDGVAPEDERTVTDLMVDQIEFSNCVIINKIDSVDKQTRERIRGLVTTLNPQARIVEAKFAQVNMNEVLATASFDFERAATSMGWLQSLHEMSKREINGVMKFAPKPETEEYGISSFVYRARRPFHPKRLYQMIHKIFVLMEDAEDAEHAQNGQDDIEMDDGEIDELISSDASSQDKMSDDDGWENQSDDGSDEGEDLSEGIDPKTIAINKRNDKDFRGLLRSKGFIWLATRPLLHGAWSQAGTMLTFQGGEQWFCTLDEEHWPQGAATKASILNDFQKPWGDRRQELVLIREKLDQKALSARFDHCLLTDFEMKRWERIMKLKRSPEAVQDRLDTVFEDGFMDWPMPGTMDDEHEHAGHSH